MNISRPFIKRPIATSLLMLGILAFGVTAYRLLPLAAVPTVDFPTINVSAQLPGASPETMASSIATPLEQQFAAIPGLTQMTSSSGLGSTSITLQFTLSRSIDAAAQDVQTAINAAGGLLPKNLPNPPTYKKVDPTNHAILIYAVSSDTLPLSKVDEYAYTILAQSISTIPGVSQVNIAGQQKFAVRVQVDPNALAARRIGMEDVRSSLTTASTNQPKGNLENAHQSIALDTNDQLFDASSFRNVIVAYRNGAPVRIRDIGEAIDAVEQNRIAAWFNNKPAEVLLIERAAGANTIATIAQVKAVLQKLQASLPPSVKVELMADRSDTILASIADVRFTLILTIGLVVMVIFLFLRKLWATVIPGVAVPLSIIGTFGVMYVLGYSLDNLSMMGLSIAVGFVVDDAIVMIENIVRYIESGDSPMEAALKGSEQIGFTIISISISLVAVFIPLLFMSGIVGRLFREFAMTVTVAVLVSAAVSLTLTPVMCALFLKHEDESEPNRFNRITEAGFEWMLRVYDRGLQWVLRHQFSTLISTLALLVFTGVLYMQIPKGFFPQQDIGFIMGEIDANQDTSFDAMSKLTRQVVDLVMQDPGVSGVTSFTGAASGSANENSGKVMIQLKPLNQRGVSSDQIIQRIRPKMDPIVGAKFFMQSAQDINVGGRTSSSQYQYTLTDTNVAELNQWAPKFEQAMKQLPGLQDVASDQQIAAPHLAIDIDRDAASRLGVTPQLIDDTLYDAFGSREVSTIYAATNEYRVILEVQPQFQTDESALSKLYVVSSSGARIPLSTFAHFVPKVASLSVNHQGQFPSITLSFNLKPGIALGDAVTRIDQMRTALHAPATLQGSFQGTAQAFQDSLSSTSLLVLAAIAVVYIVLGMLYESYIHPITILSSLPSAGVGALLMLMLFRYELSVIAIIGIILLIGIVKKNAIMMIDFALEAERHEGKNPLEAIHEACRLRFRPIMMTTMAALLGGLPLAMGHGSGSELRRPLGIAIVGGLLVSQVLTLYTTPIIYLYLDRASRWLASLRRRYAKKVESPATIASSEQPLPEVMAK